MPTALTADRVGPLFRSSFGQTYRHVQRVDSTQDQLREDDHEGTIVACEEQLAGRGRRGQAWLAPAGRALLFSILLRPTGSPPPPQLSLVAGLAVAAAIERELAMPVGLKWPNDVLVSGAKVAGILAERRDDALVLGIGVNVNQTESELPRDTPVQARSLLTIDGRERDRAALLVDIAERLESSYGTWRTSGLDPMAADLEARDILRGRRVRVDSVRGVGAGIGGDGTLLLDTEEGRQAVVGGAVEVEW